VGAAIAAIAGVDHDGRFICKHSGSFRFVAFQSAAADSKLPAGKRTVATAPLSSRRSKLPRRSLADQRPHDLHAQATVLIEREAGRQALSVVAHFHRHLLTLDVHAHPNRAAFALLRTRVEWSSSPVR